MSMQDLTTPQLGHSIISMQPGPSTEPHRPGSVRGWLLVLCLMLTVVGPAISVGLMAGEYAESSPRFSGSPGLQAVILMSLAMTTGSIVFGVYAGLRLWRLRPQAVKTAKTALLLGLAVDIATTTIDVVAGGLPADSDLFRSAFAHAMPSLIFFTLCFGYLNKSRRVQATYPSPEAGA